MHRGVCPFHSLFISLQPTESLRRGQGRDSFTEERTDLEMLRCYVKATQRVNCRVEARTQVSYELVLICLWLSGLVSLSNFFHQKNSLGVKIRIHLGLICTWWKGAVTMQTAHPKEFKGVFISILVFIRIFCIYVIQALSVFCKS